MLRKEGKMTVPGIGPTAHPTEEFECLDCFLVAALNVHGRCERCNSNAVSPFQLLERTGRWITAGGGRFWIPSVQEYPGHEQAPVQFAERHACGLTNVQTRAKTSPVTTQPEKDARRNGPLQILTAIDKKAVLICAADENCTRRRPARYALMNRLNQNRIPVVIGIIRVVKVLLGA
jgi:hypothetical protein